MGVLGVSLGVIVQSVGVVRHQVGEQSHVDRCVLVLLGEGLEQVLLSETIRCSYTHTHSHVLTPYLSSIVTCIIHSLFLQMCSSIV